MSCTCRRSLVADALENGVGVALVAALPGYTSTDMAMQHDWHLREKQDHLKQAAIQATQEMINWQHRHRMPDESKNEGGTETPEPAAGLPQEGLELEAPMRSYKRCVDSVLLERMAHADVFEIGTTPRFLFLLFGGSGVDQEEYERRSKTVIPIFGSVLEGLSNSNINAVMVYVSAPYDVPFNRFPTDPSSAATWNAHVLTELLEPWPQLPYFVSGFSGGAALALNGLEKDPRCFGGAALGADAIPPDFKCPNHWADKLRLYAAPHDRVCNHPANRRIAEALEGRGQAEEFELRSGGHSLPDYSTPDCLGELIRFAGSITPSAQAPGPGAHPGDAEKC